ncbi:MAG TPA: hypothetical protein DFS52_06310 [Myxococcales bacterium]|nr:hypothetical protein [Myxococcales bacterium]
MAWTIALLLLGNWVVGLASGAHLGWWLHVAFVLAVVSALMGLTGRMASIRSSSRRAVANRTRQPEPPDGRGSLE